MTGSGRLPLGVIVTEAERCDPPFALIRAELEWLQRQFFDTRDQLRFNCRRNEAGFIAQSRRSLVSFSEQGKLRHESTFPNALQKRAPSRAHHDSGHRLLTKSRKQPHAK